MSEDENGGFSIQQAAERTGLSVDALRYYEEIGLIAPVRRDKSSRHRRFTEAEILKLNYVREMRKTGMPIRDIQRFAETYRGGTYTEDDRIALLQAHRERICQQMARLEAYLPAIDARIAVHAEKKRLLCAGQSEGA